MKRGGEKCDSFYGPTKCKSMQRKHARYQELKQIVQTREKNSFIGWGVYTVGLFYRDKVFKKYSDSWAKVKTKKREREKAHCRLLH